jgi:uroporphyrin-III C-methyltransferase
MNDDDPAAEAAPIGRVVLVGGGPGAEDLITVRGLRALEQADVVVADRLAPIGLLRDLGPDVEIIDVGKTPHHHPVPQDEINALLVERARRGRYVVRLKGGDPFVLGRGGEELLACRAAGVPVDVVPGVTSAFAGPAAAEVPVTHRGIAHGVLVISGHDELDVPSLVAWPHTIVVLMGMRRLRELSAGLIRGGKSADTPVTVVQSAWTTEQRHVSAPLERIADRVDTEGLGNPAVIVIGDVTAVLDDRRDGHEPIE